MERTGRWASCDCWRDGGALIQEEKGIRNGPGGGSAVKGNNLHQALGRSIEGPCEQSGESRNPAPWRRSGSLVPGSSWAQGLSEC